MSWTPQQEEALRIRNKNLLLSAAAGSGKTAVLTERITRLAADPESHTGIHELLVLTFTKAAASEMKSRISASLTRELEAADAAKDLPLVRHLERQISLLSSAQISTLDAFFQSLVRQYFYLLDLDPKTRIMADENDARILADDVLTEVLERWYEEGNPDFLTTCDLFASGHQDQALRQMILRMHHYASSMPFPDVWLTRLPSAYEIPQDATLDTLSWTQPILSELIDTAGKICDLYRQSFSLLDLHPIARDVYGEMLSQEYAFFSSLAQVTTWQALYAMPSFTPQKMPILSAAKAKAYGIKSTDFSRSPEAESIKTLRNMAKDIYKKKLLPFLSITPSQWIKETRAMAPEVKVLSALALDFGRSYLARKKQEGVMEFNDLEHYTLSLLLDTKDPDFTPEHAEDFPSEAALSIRRNYKEVMI
ncbi:MAG: UvrD-helicase domain-containing protein, partial [Dialister sp.]|nr:UvrD-helicase domain-containing protein [Dialister sp.]MDY2621670.1 UvrD-helicase domain-containing protein [Dialister sp.]